MSDKISARETGAIFTQALSCSQALATVVDRALGAPDEFLERSAHPLAGGLLKSGNQCGMIWGATLASGAAVGRKHGVGPAAEATAVRVAMAVFNSFRNFASETDCLKLTGSDFMTASGKIKYIVMGKALGCARMSAQWAPKAVSTIMDSIEAPYSPVKMPSCSAIAFRNMGHSDAECVTVAGFAGGLGLSGGACGALAASILSASMKWHREHPESEESMLAAIRQEFSPRADFNGPAIDAMKRFKKSTGGAILCSEITGRSFRSVEDHSAFLEAGGCAELLKNIAS